MRQERLNLEPEAVPVMENEKPYSGPPTVFVCPKCQDTLTVYIETDERTKAWCNHNGNVLHGKAMRMKRRQEQ